VCKTYSHKIVAPFLLGIILNEGSVPGVEPNPQQAVVWWRRCADEHRHIEATYELALAMYIGEGLAENTEFAVKLFKRTAHLGHAGAAYMLGECLLEGDGTERDRGDALEWYVQTGNNAITFDEYCQRVYCTY
jgi:TPR repeat protein